MVQKRGTAESLRKSQTHYLAAGLGEESKTAGSNRQSNRRSMNFEPGGLSKLAEGSDAPKKRFLEQAVSSLPAKFDLTAVKRNPSEACMLCSATFTRALGKNPIRHCKRCGKSICQVCSEGRRRLSRADPEVHRVCDMCDAELDNFKLKQNHEEVLAA